MLKNAYLQEAIAQRRQLVSVSLRPSKRLVKKPKFHITVNVPEPMPKVKLFQNDAYQDSLEKTNSLPSPIEGIPERNELPPASYYNRGQGVHGLSPIEGLRNIHPTISTLVGSNSTFVERAGSPVEGLVHETSRNPGYARLEDANGKEPQVMDADDEDFGGGFDDGGWGDDGWAGGLDDLALPGNENGSMPPPKPRAPRRPVQNPGIRLRNQLPRKSLVYDPEVGRGDQLDDQGRIVRRSRRQRHKPSKYWLNQKNVYVRKFGALPTVIDRTRPDPKTPTIYKMISDPVKDRYEGAGVSRKKTKARVRTKSKVSKKFGNELTDSETESDSSGESDVEVEDRDNREAMHVTQQEEDNDDDDEIILNHANTKSVRLNYLSDEETEVAGLIRNEKNDGDSDTIQVSKEIGNTRETGDEIDLTLTPTSASPATYGEKSIIQIDSIKTSPPSMMAQIEDKPNSSSKAGPSLPLFSPRVTRSTRRQATDDA